MTRDAWDESFFPNFGSLSTKLDLKSNLRPSWPGYNQWLKLLHAISPFSETAKSSFRESILSDRLSTRSVGDRKLRWFHTSSPLTGLIRTDLVRELAYYYKRLGVRLAWVLK